MAQLTCVQGRVISVQGAVYGRRDKTTCATGRPASQIRNVQCSSQSKRVAESCNGKSSCSINARNSVFGDPCRGTYKYLEVDYTCQLPESQSGKVHTVACEGSMAQLTCVQGRVISVQGAVYGRRDKTTCATGRPASQIRNVHCSSQSKRVAESCNGKSSCSINARNSVFGDPCRGTYKYLEVDYTCQLPESQSGKVHTVACEGSVAQLTCVQGRVISVQGAAYGRRDKTTCATGRPASQIRNVQCSSQSKRVAESCNGKSSCSINARNSVFGDPCRGTYKYLEVDYTCQLPESFSQEVVICEGKSARLKCGKNQAIYVDKAIYGRRDPTKCARRQPSWKIKNANCSRGSIKVAKRCNGKRFCAIRARMPCSGDP
ncbi:L-rhamnose-binding lectin CSL3-like, partial [Leuresthes tenuis]|uniref:L-rhamnose-binding lectin CSL3-like n=1 Tax=Leuresthes tenuis TaxID=355514 RepID=UPI003B515002